MFARVIKGLASVCLELLAAEGSLRCCLPSSFTVSWLYLQVNSQLFGRIASTCGWELSAHGVASQTRLPP
jgi:hypothetical protein